MLLEVVGQVGDFQCSINGNKVELCFLFIVNGVMIFSVSGVCVCIVKVDGVVLVKGKLVSIIGQMWYCNFIGKIVVY